MTTPSFYKSTGISISVFKPTIDMGVPSYVPAGMLLDDSIAQQIDTYSHEILANGGWWSASLALKGALVDTEDWFDNGLNRHVEVYNPALVKIWEGFVNRVTLSAGTLSAVRGPLLDAANRASVTYTPILDATATPPIMGVQTTTLVADDAASQNKYGILEDVVSGGQLLDDGVTDEAVQQRNTFLNEMREPETTEDLGVGAMSEPTVELELLGYAHRLGRWIVQDLTAATIQIDTKLQTVMALDPNGMFSTDYAGISANALLTSRYEDDNRTAWDVIQSLVSVGDAADDRYTFGVYGGLKAFYAPLPSDTAYQHRIADPLIQIETYGTGTKIEFWDVLPAKWMFLSDFLVGRPQPVDRRLDPRYVFIESVQFSAPNDLQISGNKVGKLAQMIAKKGMF